MKKNKDRCLICYIVLNKNAPTKTDHQKLRNQLEPIFLLKKLLSVPDKICETILSKNGNPSKWGITVCPSCKGLADEANYIHNQQLYLEDKLKTLRAHCEQKIVQSFQASKLKSQNSVVDRIRREITKDLAEIMETATASTSKAKTASCRRRGRSRKLSCSSSDFSDDCASNTEEKELDDPPLFIIKVESDTDDIDNGYRIDEYEDDGNEIDEFAEGGKQRDEFEDVKPEIDPNPLDVEFRMPTLVSVSETINSQYDVMIQNDDVECQEIEIGPSEGEKNSEVVVVDSQSEITADFPVPQTSKTGFTILIVNNNQVDEVNTASDEVNYAIAEVQEAPATVPEGTMTIYLSRKRDDLDCLHCGKTFKSYEHCLHHIEMSHSGTVACQICNKTFESHSSRSAHMKAHTSKKLMCEMCPTLCKDSKQLIQHQADSHDVPLPEGFKSRPKYQCSVCESQLSSSRALMRHMTSVHRNKNEEKPLKCPLCDYRGTDKYALQKHDKHIHQRVPYPKKTLKHCPECNKQFLNNANLKLHRNSKHGKNIPVKNDSSYVQCYHCDRMLKKRSKWTLLIHLNSKHGGNHIIGQLAKKPKPLSKRAKSETKKTDSVSPRTSKRQSKKPKRMYESDSSDADDS